MLRAGAESIRKSRGAMFCAHFLRYVLITLMLRAECESTRNSHSAVRRCSILLFFFFMAFDIKVFCSKSQMLRTGCKNLVRATFCVNK